MPKKRTPTKRKAQPNREIQVETPLVTRTSDLWGHQRPWSLLTRLRQAGTFPHALLVVGPAGVGKKAFVKLASRALLCLDAQAAPCGSCAICRDQGAMTARVTDLSEAQDGVNIDSLRNLQELTHLKAFDGGHKVVLLTDADTMSEGAWNSLLKFLEEPPENLTVMLTARSEQAVPATVRSRTAILRLHPVTASTLRAALEKQGIAQDLIAWAIPRSAGLPGRLATLLTEQGAAEQRNSEELIALVHQTKTLTERWQELQKLAGATQISADDLRASLEHLEQADHAFLTTLLRGQGERRGTTWLAMLKRRLAYQQAHAAIRRNSSPTSILFSLALNS